MKRFIFALSFCFLTAVSAWTLTTGTYSLSGTNPDGSTYQGQVYISEQGDNYKVIWQIGGSYAQEGVGVYRYWDNYFTVAFKDYANGNIGVATYKLGAYCEMEGKWTGFDSTKQGNEHLKWQTYYCPPANH